MSELHTAYRAERTEQAPNRPSGVSTARRRWRPNPARQVAFVDRAARCGLTLDGRRFHLPRNATPGGILSAVPDGVVAVYVVGPPPAAGQHGMAQWAARIPADGPWEAQEHRLGRPDTFTLRYTHGRRRMTIGTVWTWFRSHSLSVDQAADAWRLLSSSVAARFDGAELMSTPAVTGGHLLLASIPRGVEWDVLAADDRRLIRETLTQGRVEFCWQGGPMDGLTLLDGRLMYPALARNLPGGPVTIDDRHDIPDLYRPARYEITACVPADWAHVGLIGQRIDGATMWPCTPGEEVNAWVDGAELLMLNRWGWDYRVHRRVMFTPYTSRGPLDGWATRLIALRDGVTHGDPQVTEAVRAAARNIAIQGIGLLVSAGSNVTRSVRIDHAANVPAHARNLRPEGDRLVWEEDGGWEELAHPEWAAAIYARCRCRLLDFRDTGALHIPRSHVAGFDTDCVYITTDPAWPDDGNPGRFRPKLTIPGPLPQPATLDNLRSYR